jgi:hypothetical protein
VEESKQFTCDAPQRVASRAEHHFQIVGLQNDRQGRASINSAIRHYSMLVPRALLSKDFLKTLSPRVRDEKSTGPWSVATGYSQTGSDL